MTIINPDLLPIESIQERDIDLILLEELNVSNHFADWFVRQFDFPELHQNLGTKRSISNYGLGETDLLFAYKSDGQTIFILIENKLDSDFQEAQYDRYQKRGINYRNDKLCADFHSVLVAPRQFAESQSDFENYITYEQIKDYSKFSDTNRSNFRANLFQIAIEKLRRGYQPINSEPVQKFFKSYHKLKEEEFPDLIMKRPTIVPFGSDWPEMRDEKLKGIIFYHKLSKGFLDASFCNFSEEVEFKIKSNLPEDTQFVKHSKRFSIRLKTQKIDRTKDFDTQKESVISGLKALDQLRLWLRKQHKLTGF